MHTNNNLPKLLNLIEVASLEREGKAEKTEYEGDEAYIVRANGTRNLYVFNIHGFNLARLIDSSLVRAAPLAQFAE